MLPILMNNLKDRLRFTMGAFRCTRAEREDVITAMRVWRNGFLNFDASLMEDAARVEALLRAGWRKAPMEPVWDWDDGGAVEPPAH